MLRLYIIIGIDAASVYRETSHGKPCEECGLLGCHRSSFKSQLAEKL
ncbi:hypothetical protein H6G81_19305 [Scytonema hofmannii FACHB-248]|uniref:Uncharacterized protein n=1 Tax=Scytonema hofmannii FACHB-248 TaxID=1842502 RepID=A0ABR8GU66_9CYAN|nr:MULTISPECIES: hypothetical protein [Nostocales]MBD2606620.1 hypothetical protein [Scytonema hofmannii FACHB-248]